MWLFKKSATPSPQVAPKELWRVWFKDKALAEKAVAHDPVVEWAFLMASLAHMKVPQSKALAIIDAAKHKRYQIVPAPHSGEGGFESHFFLSCHKSDRVRSAYLQRPANLRSFRVNRSVGNTDNGLVFSCPLGVMQRCA